MNNKRRYYKTEERAKQVLNILRQNKPSLAEKLSVKFDRTDGYYLSRTYQINNRDETGRQYNKMSIEEKENLLKQIDMRFESCLN